MTSRTPCRSTARGVVVAQRQEHELGVDLGDRPRHGLGQLGVLRAHRVERAVGLHVCRAGRPPRRRRPPAPRSGTCSSRSGRRARPSSPGARSRAGPAGPRALRSEGRARGRRRRSGASLRGSPAWNPHAMFAEEMWGMRLASSPRLPATEALTHVDVHVDRIQLVHRLSRVVDAVAGPAPARSSSR